MSCPDYSQSVDDHYSLLILVKQVGCHLKPKAFNRIYERISRIRKVNIHSQQRIIRLRYTKCYPLENNDWGEFQVHRKVVGLICVGKCDNDNEVGEIYRLYEDINSAYSHTLYDSRLILFGLNKDGSLLEQRLCRLSESDGNDLELALKDIPPSAELEGEGQVFEDTAEHSGNGDQGAAPNKDTFKSHVLCYPHEDKCPHLEEALQDYVASLFWILDAKRLDRSYERQDKPPLLMTPFEKSSSGEIDTDTRLYKKRCQNRLKKHLGDLCMLAGLPGEALLHYSTALEALKSTEDWMWLAGTYEGICVASIAISKPQTELSSLSRNSSYSSFSTKRASSAIRERLKPVTRAIDDLDDNRLKSTLAVDDVIGKYKEALLHYSKFPDAGVIEMEASVKACRLAIDHHKYLAAADFLQNIIYINLNLSDTEKIERYSVMSGLYNDAGMHRKAALFRRLAGMQCVSLTNPKPTWNQCYHLLLEALGGYKLSLDAKDYPRDHPEGWPLIQMRILHEIIYTARKMGTPAIAIRHLCYLLHVMFAHLKTPERQELSAILESYTMRCESQAQSLVLDNGTILPPVALTHFPLVRSFMVLESAPHLRPVRLNQKPTNNLADATKNLFIYSPLQQAKVKERTGICLVQHETCDVVLQLFNPMPYELKITFLSILSEGAACEFVSQSLSLPAESGPYKVKVTGEILQAGLLKIIGYRIKVLGVWSHCRLRDLDDVIQDETSVKVTPPLPRLHVTTSLPGHPCFSTMENSDIVVSTASLSLYAGESCECTLKLTNISKNPVEHISLSLLTSHHSDALLEMVKWNADNLVAQLPLLPEVQASLTLYFNCLSDITNIHTDDSFAWGQEVEGSATPKVLESLLQIEYTSQQGLAEEFGRQCAVNLMVEVLPSIVIRGCDILQAASDTQCTLVLDVYNSTEHTAEILCPSQATLTVHAGHCKRYCVQIPRYDPKSASPSDYLEPDFPDTLHSETDSLHSKSLVYHIHNSVELTWKLPSENKSGQLLLDKLHFTPSMLNAAQISKFVWRLNVSCNESKILGVPQMVTWSLLNQSEEVLVDARACIEVYQDDGSPERSVSVLCTHVLQPGPAVTALSKLSPGEEFSGVTSLIFLQAGSYKVKVKVTCRQPSPEGDSVELLQFVYHSPGTEVLVPL